MLVFPVLRRSEKRDLILLVELVSLINQICFSCCIASQNAETLFAAKREGLPTRQPSKEKRQQSPICLPKSKGLRILMG